VKGIERRRIGELSARDVPGFGAGGLAAGLALFSAVAGVLWLAGSYHVLGTNGHADWLPQVLAIEAGVLLALLYLVTRSLWACIGLHAGWNIAQGTVYGIPVSGTRADGWLVSTRTGPDWLSGGAFGAEASVVALVLCSLCSVALLVVAWRRHAFVPPGWRRS
jgi:membrane protease YdiL (CAAX protease family)